MPRVLFALVFAATLAPAADPKKDYGTLFPAIGGMYDTKIGKPEVGKGDPPDTYSQTCTYAWTGGRIESITVTLARDPAFKDKYSAEAMKKEKAEAVKVGKKAAYLWPLPDDKGAKLVIVLADDKAVIVEQTGTGQDLTKWAAKWKLDAIEKALDTPPAAK